MSDESEIVSLSEWIQIVGSRLNTSQFEIVSYTMKRLVMSGGYLGEHSLAEVTARLGQETSAPLVLHFFVKAKPLTSNSQLTLIERSQVFEKETTAVSSIFEKFRSVLKENGKGTEWACECFYTRPDILVLEDLTHHGFRASSHSESLKYQHFALVMKALANLHSACIIYEETQPTQPYHLIDDYQNVLRETFFTDEPPYPGITLAKVAARALCTLIELMHGKEVALQLKSKVSGALNLVFKLQRPSDRFRNVVCQGDVRRENILFLHDQDEPIDVRLVDYQLIRYAPPANDIMCFLHLSGSKEIREKYGSKLLATYYDHFSSNLHRHSLDPNKIFPRREFEESCNLYHSLGMLLSMFYSPVTLMPQDFLTHVFGTSEDYDRFVNVDRSPEVIKAYESDSSYRENIRIVVDEFIQEFIEKTPKI